MPKDNIDRVLKKATGGGEETNYEEIRYEGYGPGGVAIIVDALTDNRNRTASEVRAAFSKYGGNLGETNSVGFMFDRIGLISYPKDLGSSEVAFEAAVESGASDVEATQSGYEFICGRRNSITCGNIWKTNMVHRNQLVCPGSRKALSSYLQTRPALF